MRLCIDASNIRSGGGVTHLVELLRNADAPAHGFDKVFVWGRAATLARIAERPWLVKRTAPVLERHYLRRALWQRNRLGECARDDGCDLLFVPGGSFATDFRPVVTMSRNMLPFDLRELLRYGVSTLTVKFLLLRWTQARSFRHADGTIFLTRYAHDAVLAVTGLLRGQTATVPHGVDTRFFEPPRPPRALADCSAAAPLRIVYVSMVDVYKHQPRVAEAVAQLRAQGLALHLDLVGPAHPPSLRKLQRTLRSVDPLGEGVRYLGALPHDELHAVYAAADMGVFASSCENMPNILLEGMAAGLPLACSQRGPMPEVLGDAGLYFDPERTASIADAISELATSPALRHAKANAAWQRAQQYSWARCANETFAFLGQVGQQGGARSVGVVSATAGTAGVGTGMAAASETSPLRKLARFVSIYGLRKTLFKAFGRSRSMPGFLPFARPARVRDIGLIGCGQFGFATIGYSITSQLGNRFADCFDVDAAAQKSFATFYKTPSSAPSADALIANPRVQVVYVASNHASHADYAVRALNAGKQVYLEKPISVDHGQFRRLLTALRRPGAPAIFAGYNRPFSQAVRDLAGDAADAQGPVTLNCFITGHAIAADHWYRDPREGTRICGNVGHWLDLAVHMLSWRDLPDRWTIGFAWSRPEARDDDMTLTLTSERGDLVVITLTSRSEPFEGINETINFQQSDVIAKIDDFRTMTVWKASRVRRRRYWPKDVGHSRALIQPFSTQQRSRREVELSTLLMLFVKDMAVAGQRVATFSFADEWRKLGLESENAPSSLDPTAPFRPDPCR
jgi:glycosyltransferase involved in cell wall biosynthesis/predicted dehydrogenase